MKNRNKISVKLSIVLFLMIFPALFPFAVGHNNQPIDRVGERETVGADYIPSLYVFTDTNIGLGGRPRNCYGTHDWVADSAVRLILDNEAYDDLVEEWLFVRETEAGHGLFGDSINNKAPFKKFGETELISNGKEYHYWSNLQKSFEMTDYTWLRARRYVQFLHGTGTPDWKRDFIQIDDGYVPTEQIHYDSEDKYTVVWKNTLKKHVLRFDFIKYSYITVMYPDVTLAAILAQCASEDAEYFANLKKEYEDNQGNTKEIRGKWEAVAQCLGGMTHFIADMACPGHIYQEWPKDAHEHWEKFLSYGCKLGPSGGQTDEWPDGGPNWGAEDGVDPWQVMEAKGKTLTPMRPEAAAIEMAETAFAAIDLYGPVYDDDFLEDSSKRKFAIGNPDFPKKVYYSDKSDHLEYKARMKDLVGLAAYYSACAMIYTLERCNVRNQNTLVDRLAYHPALIISEFTEIPHSVPQSAAEIEIMNSHYQRDYIEGGKVASMNLMLVMAIMVPIVALLIIPKWIPEAIAKKEDLISEEAQTPFQQTQ